MTNESRFNIIHIPKELSGKELQSILSELPEFTSVEIIFEDSPISIRGIKQNNQIMILQMKDKEEKYNRKSNEGFRKAGTPSMYFCLDIDKLGELKKWVIPKNKD